jgi:hypothetical protein
VQAVHTIGQDLDNLRLCYNKALDFVGSRKLRTVAFSLLGTSRNLKCPGELAAQVALETTADWLLGSIPGEGLERVILCAHGAQAQKDLEKAVSEWGREPSVEPAPPAPALPDPTPVNQVEEFDWEQGVGPEPLSESILRALAQEVESAGEPSPVPWYRPHPGDPPLPTVWATDEEQRLQTFQSLAHSPQFGRLWKHLEPDLGPCIPVLEFIPGDGDCLYRAVSKYLEKHCSGNMWLTP